MVGLIGVYAGVRWFRGQVLPGRSRRPEEQ
jgi:hypothetical protein